MVVVPGTEGNFGVLPGHAPLISTVRPGMIDIYEGRDGHRAHLCRRRLRRGDARALHRAGRRGDGARRARPRRDRSRIADDRGQSAEPARPGRRAPPAPSATGSPPNCAASNAQQAIARAKLQALAERRALSVARPSGDRAPWRDEAISMHGSRGPPDCFAALATTETTATSEAAWARGRSTTFRGTASTAAGSIRSIVRLVKAASLVEHNGARLCPPSVPCLRRRSRVPGAARGAGARRRSSTARRWRAGRRWPTRLSISPPLSPASRPASASISTADRSRRGSRAGEMVARCIVETGTSSYYTALREAAAEPVLQEICRRIAADEIAPLPAVLQATSALASSASGSGCGGGCAIALGRVAEARTTSSPTPTTPPTRTALPL